MWVNTRQSLVLCVESGSCVARSVLFVIYSLQKLRQGKLEVIGNSEVYADIKNIVSFGWADHGAFTVEHAYTFVCSHSLQYAYGSRHAEPAYEEIPFTEPAEDVGDIYDQLAQEKCIEIPRIALK